MTAALVLVVLLMTSRTRTARWTPLLLWPVIAALVWQGAPYTGTGLNPARSLGPALLAPLLGPYWVYAAGPRLGGALAVGAFALLRDRHVLTAKLPGRITAGLAALGEAAAAGTTHGSSLDHRPPGRQDHEPLGAHGHTAGSDTVYTSHASTWRDRFTSRCNSRDVVIPRQPSTNTSARHAAAAYVIRARDAGLLPPPKC